MPRKYYIDLLGKGGDTAGLRMAKAQSAQAGAVRQQRMITCDLLTVQMETAEGQFNTFPSLVFEGEAYEEAPGSIVYLPNEYGYPPPGAVKVSARVREFTFAVIDNFQSGADAEGELPLMAIYEGSAYWEDTGEPVMTMEEFRGFMAAAAETPAEANAADSEAPAEGDVG